MIDEVELQPAPFYSEWIKLYGGPGDSFHRMVDVLTYDAETETLFVKRTITPRAYVESIDIDCVLEFCQP